MTIDRLDAITPASWRRLNALGSVTSCWVCGEPSLDGIHPNCASPSVWPTSAITTSPKTVPTRTRRCQACHGKGWRLPNCTRDVCRFCAGAGIITWRTPT